MKDPIVRAPIFFWGIKSKTTGKTYSKDFAEKAVEQINSELFSACFAVPLDVKYTVGVAKNAEILGNVVYADIELWDNAPDEVKESWDLNNIGFTLIPRVFSSAEDKDVLEAEDLSHFTHVYCYTG